LFRRIGIALLGGAFCLASFSPLASHAQVVDGVVSPSATYQSPALNSSHRVLVDNQRTTRSVLTNHDTFFNVDDFDISLSEDARGNILFSWDFGDGTPIVEGERVIHRFIREGIYRVSLIARLDDDELVEHLLVSVFQNQVIFLGDNLSPSLVNEIVTKFALDKTDAVVVNAERSLGGRDFRKRYMTSTLVQNNLEDFLRSDFIFVHGSLGLDVLVDLSDVFGFDFSHKTIVLLDSPSGVLSRRWYSFVGEHLSVNRLILASSHFSFDRFLKNDFSEYDVIDLDGDHSQLSRFSPDALVVLFAFLFASILAFFLRTVFQVRLTSISILAFASLAWLQLGVWVGLFAYLFFGGVSFGVRYLAQKNILRFVSFDVTKLVSSLVLFVCAFVLSSHLYAAFDVRLFLLSFIFLLFVVEVLSLRRASFSLYDLLGFFARDLVFLLSVVSLFSFVSVRAFALSFPIVFLVGLFVLGAFSFWKSRKVS